MFCPVHIFRHEQKYAKGLIPLVKHHHLLLVTLLLANAGVMEALPYGNFDIVLNVFFWGVGSPPSFIPAPTRHRVFWAMMHSHHLAYWYMLGDAMPVFET